MTPFYFYTTGRIGPNKETDYFILPFAIDPTEEPIFFLLQILTVPESVYSNPTGFEILFTRTEKRTIDTTTHKVSRSVSYTLEAVRPKEKTPQSYLTDERTRDQDPLLFEIHLYPVFTCIYSGEWSRIVYSLCPKEQTVKRYQDYKVCIRCSCWMCRDCARSWHPALCRECE